MKKLNLKRFRDSLESVQLKKIKRVKSNVGTSQESGLRLEWSPTIGNILCCKCGIPTPPNKAYMCEECLDLEIHIDDLPSRISIIHCPDCVSYLEPLTTWLKAEPESKELLSFCLRRLKKLPEFRLIDAKLVHTKGHSKRMMLWLKVQRQVLEEQVVAEKEIEIEYFVVHRKCEWCIPRDHDDNWGAVVQVRQYAPHMHTLHYLRGAILKHHAADSVVKLKPAKQGFDFMFAKKCDAVKFFNFICRVVQVKPHNRFHKKLMSQDSKSSIPRYSFSITADITPICPGDLIYFSPTLSSRFGQIGPLLICAKVNNTITLMNPFTLNRCTIDAKQYWRTPFRPILTSELLIVYIILDVTVVSTQVNRGRHSYVLADVEIARVSDFGKNDRIISVRTHLGHILKPNDYVLGYDLCAANINNSEVEEQQDALPDAVLVQKTYTRRKWRVKSSKASVEKKTNDSAHKQLLEALSVDLDSRLKISSSDDGSSQGMDSAAPGAVPTSQLELDFSGLGLNDADSDGCVTDAE